MESDSFLAETVGLGAILLAAGVVAMAIMSIRMNSTRCLHHKTTTISHSKSTRHLHRKSTTDSRLKSTSTTGSETLTRLRIKP